MEDWHAVDVSGLTVGETRAVEVAGRSVLVCRADGAYYALENRCPHAATPLTGARLAGCVLECPVHGGKLDVRDGRPCAQPIRKPATTFAVRAAGDKLEIRLDGPDELRSPPARGSLAGARCAGADS